jgi:hypothetical protein
VLRVTCHFDSAPAPAMKIVLLLAAPAPAMKIVLLLAAPAPAMKIVLLLAAPALHRYLLAIRPAMF